MNDIKVKKKKNYTDDVYSFLIVSPNIKKGLYFLILITFFVFFSLVFAVNSSNQNWTSLLIPILLFGGFLSFYPAAETWRYSPWQKTHKQMERHFDS